MYLSLPAYPSIGVSPFGLYHSVFCDVGDTSTSLFSKVIIVQSFATRVATMTSADFSTFRFISLRTFGMKVEISPGKSSHFPLMSLLHLLGEISDSIGLHLVL